MKIPVHPSRFRRRRLLGAGRTVVLGMLLAAVFAVAWHARFSVSPAPLADEDVWGYLAPPMNKLTGGAFDHTFSREWLYPAFLLVNLFCFNSFLAISRCQHLLGLLGGVFVWAAWRELTGLVRTARPFVFRESAAWASGLMGVALVATYLMSRRTLLFEHSLRPEAVFPCFGALHVYLMLGFVRRWWGVPARRDAAVRWGAGALFVTCVVLLLRPAFGFAAVFANLPVAAALLDRGTAWRARVRLAVVPMTLAVLLLFLPERLLSARDRVAIIMMPAARVAIHADIVRAQIADDLARPGGPPRYDRAWLEKLKARFDYCFAQSALPEHRWRILGFSADYMLAVERFWDGSFPDTADGDHELAAFCNYYFYRTWLHRPLPMLRKIGRELGLFYHFNRESLRPRNLAYTRDTYSQLERVSLTAPAYYQRTVRSLDVPALRERMARSDAFRRYLAACQAHTTGNGKASVIQPKNVGVMLNVVPATYLPVLGLALASALAIALRPVWRARAGRAAGAVTLLFSYNFGMCLTVAAVQTLGTARYIENQLVFTLFSWWAGLWLLGTCLATAAWPSGFRLRGT